MRHSKEYMKILIPSMLLGLLAANVIIRKILTTEVDLSMLSVPPKFDMMNIMENLTNPARKLSSKGATNTAKLGMMNMLGNLTRQLSSKGAANIARFRQAFKVNETSGLPILPIVTETFRLENHSHVTFTNGEMVKKILGSKRVKALRSSALKESLVGFKPRIYPYLLKNEDLCTRKDFVVCVYSLPERFDARLMLRRTWGQSDLFPRLSSATVFLLGATEDTELQKSILDESKRHGDIVQTNFMDHPKNLSLKGIQMLHWVHNFCSNVKFIIKADDDVYVDMFQVVNVLRSASHLKRFIIGSVITDAKILRPNTLSKWAVPNDIMPGATLYPPYFQSSTFIMSSDIISAMYDVAMKTPMFPINDVWMTGLLASQIPGITFIKFEGRIEGNIYLPSQFNLAMECDALGMIRQWCKHLNSLSDEQKKSIGENRVSKLQTLQCQSNRG